MLMDGGAQKSRGGQVSALPAAHGPAGLHGDVTYPGGQWTSGCLLSTEVWLL